MERFWRPGSPGHVRSGRAPGRAAKALTGAVDDVMGGAADLREHRQGGDSPVSVCMITYEHEAFVAQAIESVLAQRTSFPIELVIGEDGSSDRTRDICEHYERARPDVVRLLPRRGRRGMVANHLDTLRSCRGAYVALCDGDDYWIDSEKLERQVEFLETHPDFDICFHEAWLEYPDGHREPWVGNRWREDYGARDLFNEWLITTASVIFRRPGVDELPSYLDRATHYDLALLVFLADRGRIGYLDRVMSVYRRHSANAVNSPSYSGPGFHQREISFLKEMDRWFRGAYHAAIRRRVAGLMRADAVHFARQGRLGRALRDMLAALHYRPRPDKGLLLDLARLGAALLGHRRL
jgi:glycosyltransferase involved in cell wall biosynthesis